MNATAIAMDISDNPVVIPDAAPTPVRVVLSPKKIILTAAAICITAATAIGGWHLYNGFSTHESTDDAYVDGHMTQISSRVSGTVSQVLISDNQLVKQGQILAALDPRDYDLKVLQAKAALLKAQQQVAMDKASVTQTATTADAQNDNAQGDSLKAQAAIASAMADLQQSQAQVKMQQAKVASLQAQQDQAARDNERFRLLASAGAVSTQQYDQAKTQFDMDTANTQAAQAELVQSRAKVLQSQAALQQARGGLKTSQGAQVQAQAAQQQTSVKSGELAVDQANVEQANADLQNALLQKSYTTIVAPMSGRIGKKDVEVGEQVQVGQALLNVIPQQQWITANFKETQIGRMHTGEPVEITLDAFPGKKFEGAVDSISPASGAKYALLPPDNATGNFTKVVQRVSVKIVFDSKSIAPYINAIVPGLRPTSR